MKTLISIVLMVLIFSACSKQDLTNESLKKSTDLVNNETYVSGIKVNLKDSLSVEDYNAINFSNCYKSKDIKTKNFFARFAFTGEKMSDKFLLLQTDSLGNVIKGKIIKVSKNTSNSNNLRNNNAYNFVLKSLDGKSLKYLSRDKNNNPIASNAQSNLMAEDPIIIDNTLPDVVVTGYTYNEEPIDWFMYDALLDMGGSGGSGYTYGSSTPGTYSGGGGSSVSPDQTVDISYEDANEPAIDVAKYLKCFSNLSDAGAEFKIAIYTDIPVNSDPNLFFDWNTGACGHSFIQLTKTNGSTTIQQTIGFYPESGYKSILANSPVTSKVSDNAGHEFNASLTINTDAIHFQNAITQIQSEASIKYDIDNFNCTDFALDVFNSVAPVSLSIPQYHIPGGLDGQVSNTPQGLYNELSTLSKSNGYTGGDIQIPGVAGYIGESNGACD